MRRLVWIWVASCSSLFLAASAPTQVSGEEGVPALSIELPDLDVSADRAYAVPPDAALASGLAPVLLIWGCALVAAACCDAVTQRVPTALVRQAGVVTCTVLAVVLVLHGDWPGLALSGVAALASGLVMLLCWRFVGAGFGDVRLATLGGLGLGHATHRGLLLALAAFTLITVTQAVVTLMRGGDRRSTIPYGPALAVGFLLAAAL